MKPLLLPTIGEDIITSWGPSNSSYFNSYYQSAFFYRGYYGSNFDFFNSDGNTGNFRIVLAF